MAITIEDILLERQRRQKDPVGGFPPPETDASMRYQEALDYLRTQHEQGPGEQPPTPTILDRTPPLLPAPEPPLEVPKSIKSAATGVLTSLGERYVQEAEQGRAQASGIIGAGEAAASMATGMVGATAGVAGVTQQLLSDIERSVPADAHYWEHLVKKGHEISAQYTYEPRTPEGKAALERVAPAMEALHAFSERASQAPLSRMLFTEDQRKAVAYAHELLTMMALGELGGAAKGIIGRKLSGDFQKSFIEATKEPSGGPSTTRLGELADAIAVKAQKSPEIMQKFSPERVDALRAKQQEQGFAELDTGLERIREISNFEKGQGTGLDPVPAPEEMPHSPAIKSSQKSQATNDPTGALASPDEIRAYIANNADATPSRVQRKFNIGYNRAKAFMDEAKTEEVVPALSEMDKGIAEGSYKSMYDRLQKGQLPDPFPEAQQSAFGRQALEAFKRGEVKSWEDLQRLANTQKENPYVIQGERGGPYEVIREGTTPQIFSNRRSAERYMVREWKNEQAGAETKALDETLRTIRAPSDVSAKIGSEEKLQALEHANEPGTRPEMIQRIQDSLESGTDISREIYDAVPGAQQAHLAVTKYNQLRAMAHEGTQSSMKRSYGKILNDIMELFAFEREPLSTGLGLLELTHRQKMAAQRLSADALRDGKTLVAQMEEEGIHPVLQEAVKKYLTNEMRAIIPPGGEGPRNVRLSAESMPGGSDPIIETQTTKYGLLGPRLRSSETRVFQGANRGDYVGQYSWKPQSRVVTDEFGKPVADMIFPPLRRAAKAVKEEVVGMREDLRRLSDLVRYKDRKEITQNVMEGNLASLKGTNRRVYDTLGNGVAQQLVKADEVRYSLGIEPLPSIDDPVLFMRAVNAARSQGEYINLAKSPASAVRSLVDRFSEAPMKPTWTQKALRLSSESDIFRQYDKFATQISEQLAITPLTERMRALVNHSHLDMAKNDGSYYNTGIENPAFKDYINRLANFTEGIPTDPLMVKIGNKRVNMDHLFRALNENLSFSMLSGNLRSVIAQPFSLIPTFHEAGILNTFKAIGDSLASVVGKGDARRRAISESNVISTRESPAMFGSILSDISGSGNTLKNLFETGKEGIIAIREGRIRDVSRALAQVGMSAMEAADYEAAIITKNAFRRKGEALGLQGEALNNFSDNGVINTQASGARWDIPTIQRSALGRTLTQFQTFTFTDFSWMVNNILKPSMDQPIMETVKDVGKLVAIGAAFNTVAEHLFGIDPPTPTPIKTFMKSQEKGDQPFTTAFKVAADVSSPFMGPFASLVKMGRPIGGPLPSVALDLSLSLLDRPGSQNALEPLSKFGGVPGSASWWRIQRGSPDATLLERGLNAAPAPAGAAGGGSLTSGLTRGRGQGLKSGLE